MLPVIYLTPPVMMMLSSRSSSRSSGVPVDMVPSGMPTGISKMWKIIDGFIIEYN